MAKISVINKEGINLLEQPGKGSSIYPNYVTITAGGNLMDSILNRDSTQKAKQVEVVVDGSITNPISFAFNPSWSPSPFAKDIVSGVLGHASSKLSKAGSALTGLLKGSTAYFNYNPMAYGAFTQLVYSGTSHLLTTVQIRVHDHDGKNIIADYHLRLSKLCAPKSIMNLEEAVSTSTYSVNLHTNLRRAHDNGRVTIPNMVISDYQCHYSDSMIQLENGGVGPSYADFNIGLKSQIVYSREMIEQIFGKRGDPANEDEKNKTVSYDQSTFSSGDSYKNGRPI